MDTTNTYNNIKVHLGHGTFMPKVTNNSSKPHEDNNVIEVVSLNGCTTIDGGVDTTTPTINIKARLGDGTCMPKTKFSGQVLQAPGQEAIFSCSHT